MESLLTLWHAVLGPDADTGAGFLANGGTSYGAVRLATLIYEKTGREIDYLDILAAGGLEAVRELVGEAVR